jgi:hypothetical protein
MKMEEIKGIQTIEIQPEANHVQVVFPNGVQPTFDIRSFYDAIEKYGSTITEPIIE